MTDIAEASVPPIRLPALFLKFLCFGALAFGGPVAQIAMIRQALVEDERWIDVARFNRLLAILQVLPGPEAHELCVHLGMVARGRWGGLLAGLGFMLPGLVLMLACAWAYTHWVAGLAGMSGILLGVQIAVLAVISRAVVRIGRHVVIDKWLGAIAAVALIAALFQVPFWVLLVAGGLAYAAVHRAVLWVAVFAMLVFGAMTLGLSGGDRMIATDVVQAAPSTIGLFLAGLKGGLLTFGGAYTAIPYVRADTVGRGWISDGSFLDGIALAGLLPAPLVIFATFVGYVAGGLGGAMAITVGMFLPAFAFSMIFFERLEAVVNNAALHRVLEGVAASVVGIIGATMIQLGMATASRVADLPIAAALFLVTLLCAWRWRGAWVTPVVVAAGGVIGAMVPF